MSTNTATKAVAWSNQYSVGVARIDSEHQKLLAMLNDLQAAMMEGRGRAVIGKILDDLASYTVTHFANEEKLLQLYSYPDFDRHKAIHDKLVAQVNSLQQEFRSGNATVSLEVLSFLQNWLVDHIVGVDQKYAPHLHAAGVR
jgi:hemerythrin-like metal-binding protein